MREFLKSTDNRRLSLIELLLEADDWMTIAELSKQLNSSTRALKEDISFIRNYDPNIQFQTGPKGIRIISDYSTGIQDYYSGLLRETLPFQILEELFFNENLSMSELGSILESSPSTICRTIDQLNCYFSAYDCRIESNPCRFVGNERYIRNYYRAYFKEVSTVFDWPFRDYEEYLFDEMLNSVIAFLAKFSDLETDFVDFAFYDIVKTMITVNIIRYKQGHLVDTRDEESLLFKAFFNALKFFILPKNIKEFEGLSITSEVVYQLFYPYLKENIAIGIEPLNKLRKKNPTVNLSVSYLETYLRNFSEQMEIDIPEFDWLIASLYGTTYLEDDDPNAFYILYNRNKLFAQHVKHQYPMVYETLYTGIVEYRKRLNKPLHEDKIYLLLYTLITNWNNLLVELHERFQKVSLLVISDSHFSHAKMIQNLLSFELRQNVTIHTFHSPEISVEKLKSSDYDLILSTFKLPDLNDKATIIIEHYPRVHDIKRIEKLLNCIIEDKQQQLTK